MRIIGILTKVAFCVVLLAYGEAHAFQLGEARYVNEQEGLSARIKVLDVDRNQSSNLSGELFSLDETVPNFEFGVAGAGKDIDLLVRLNRSITQPLEFVLVLQFEELVTSRRYQFNPSSTEPLDGGIEVDVNKIGATPIVAKFVLSLAETIYVVQQDQTLWDIAADTADLGGNNFQRALAIYATNRHQFRNGDINTIETRTVLAIPSETYVKSFDPERSATVFFGSASGQLLIDAFLESAERIATSSEIQIPTEQMILARRVRFLEQQLEELDEKYSRKFRRLNQTIDRRLRDLEDQGND